MLGDCSPEIVTIKVFAVVRAAPLMVIVFPITLGVPVPVSVTLPISSPVNTDGTVTVISLSVELGNVPVRVMATVWLARLEPNTGELSSGLAGVMFESVASPLPSIGAVYTGVELFLGEGTAVTKSKLFTLVSKVPEF